MRFTTLAATLLLVSSCTSVSVQKVDAHEYPMHLVCTEHNEKVLGNDLVPVIEAGFLRHGIRTKVCSEGVQPDCEYSLWYTGLRGWDITPFLKHVELRLKHNGETIATATYHHSGGLGLNKWASTQSKLTPVIDELLAEFGPQATPGAESQISSPP